MYKGGCFQLQNYNGGHHTKFFIVTFASHGSLDSKEKAKFTGMVRKMENPNFIINLGLMFDALWRSLLTYR